MPVGLDLVQVKARFAYGPDKDGVAGWFFLMGPEPHPDSQGEVGSSKAHAIKRVVAEFPESARMQGVTYAECAAHFTIDDQGAPSQVEVYNFQQEFQRSVLEAAAQWRFDQDSLTPGGLTSFILNVKFQMP